MSQSNFTQYVALALPDTLPSADQAQSTAQAHHHTLQQSCFNDTQSCSEQPSIMYPVRQQIRKYPFHLTTIMKFKQSIKPNLTCSIRLEVFLYLPGQTLSLEETVSMFSPSCPFHSSGVASVLRTLQTRDGQQMAFCRLLSLFFSHLPTKPNLQCHTG